jgi:hypothetical protein
VSQYLHVFAASAEDFPADELTDVATSSWYGDGELGVREGADSTDSADSTEAADGGHWLLLDLPGAGRRPIAVLRDTDPSTVSAAVDEELAERDDVPAELAAALHRTRQIVSFEIAPDEMDSDAWELLDVLQSVLARRLDGLVLAEDGIYDAELQRLG